MNAEEIRKWHHLFKRPDELFELRLLGENGTFSGYFYDVEAAITALQPFQTLNIYYTINEVKAACASRSQFGQFLKVRGTATSKNDIEHRWWVPVDIDCERPSGVSSTDEEKAKALAKARQVYRHLQSCGFSEPVVCDSSSGFHILYPVDLPNDQETEDTIRHWLENLSLHFSDEAVKIDTVLYDANRIIRLPGTFGRKGRSTTERPHRLASIMSAPQVVQRMTADRFKGYNIAYGVKTEQPQRTYTGGAFNLRQFIRDHHIEVEKETPLPGGGTKYVLKECPFDSSHKAPDAAIFEMPSGAISFKCFHNSCSGHDWHELRQRLDPTAYTRPQVEPQRLMRPTTPPQPQIAPETQEKGKKWLSISDIEDVNTDTLPRVKTLFKELDKYLGGGLFLSETTIVSGVNGSGKSSWLNTLALNAIEGGSKVALWTGELQATRLKRWFIQAAAGDDHVIPGTFDGTWNVSAEVSAKIAAWTAGKFYLYNNEYSNNYAQLLADMEEPVREGVTLFILDNLFAMDLEGIDGDDNARQKALILALVAFAKKHNVHVVLVAHPRKVVTFLRKEDILGSSALQNAVDNILIIHRTNDDFQQRAGTVFERGEVARLMTFDNVIEMCKNREMGVIDKKIGLYFKPKSRRFTDGQSPMLRYSWGERQEWEQQQAQQQNWDRPFGEIVDERPF